MPYFYLRSLGRGVSLATRGLQPPHHPPAWGVLERCLELTLIPVSYPKTEKGHDVMKHPGQGTLAAAPQVTQLPNRKGQRGHCNPGPRGSTFRASPLQQLLPLKRVL